MMEVLAGFAGFFLAIVGGLAIILGIAVGLPVWLHHRRRMVEMRGTQAQQFEDMRNRIDVLEQKCEKLTEQVLECQTQMADEGRELDQRLSQLLSERGQ